MTQSFPTLQQNGTYSCSGLSSFITHIQYQNIHVVNVQWMFPLRQRVCLITQEIWGQLTHHNYILAYAAVLKRIFSRRCAVSLEGPLGNCVTQGLSLFSTRVNLTLQGRWVTHK